MGKTIFLGIGGHWASGNSLSLMYRGVAEELVRREWQVVVLIPGLSSDQLVTEGNPQILTWPSRRPTRFKDAIYLARLIKQYRPTCLIANFASVNWMMLVGWLFGVKKRIAWYHTVIDAAEERNWITELKIFRKRLVYKLATHIVAVSDFVKSRDLVTEYRVLPEKITVFHNMVGDPLSAGLVPCPEKNILTYTGRLEYWKGVDILIKAMPEIVSQYPDVSLRILGDGSKRIEYQNLIRNLGVDNHILFLGSVSPNQVLQELSQSYLHLHPARADNCPLSVIEAISLGIPVIASNVGGIPEIIRDGQEGFLVSTGSPELLAEKVVQVLENPFLRNELSRRARERFLDSFELSKGVMKIVDWLENER